MRHRIPYIATALIIVILGIAAFGYPTFATTNGPQAPGPVDSQSSGSSGSGSGNFGTPPVVPSSSNFPTSGTNSGNFGTPLDVPAASSASNPTAANPYLANPPAPTGTAAGSGAANSGSAGISPYTPCDPFSFNLHDCTASFMANVAYGILGSVSFLVTIAGAIMSFTIVLTLHIREFVNATPAIFEVWTTLRDVTSLFFIFFLLYAAFKIILGMDQKIGELIKNLVLAGILINFSFFITGALIDASNIVSQTLYNAMVPVSASAAAVADITSSNNSDGSNPNPNAMSNMLRDVTGMDPNNLQNVDNTKYGISDIFRNALKLTSVSGSSADTEKAAIADPLKTFFIIVVGIIIMIMAGLSFLIAAAAFIIRLIALLFLLALSPLWFASWVIPQLKKEFDFADHLSKQLIFMPVYLLLMYVALKIIAGSNILMAASANVAGVSTGGNWAFSYIILGINFSIIIVILNLPLVVGIKMSGHLGDMIKKFDGKAVWKGAGSIIGRNVGGRAAAGLRDSSLGRSIERTSPFAGRLINTGLTKVASGGFGGGKSAGFDQVRKKKIETYAKLAEHSKLNEEEAAQKVNKGGMLLKDSEHRQLMAEGIRISKDKENQEKKVKALEKEKADLIDVWGDSNPIVARKDAEVREAQRELEKLEGAFKAKDKEVQERGKKIVAGVQDEPKNAIAEKFVQSRRGGIFGKKGSSKFGKAVAAAIRKGKKPEDDILSMLNEIKSKTP